MELEAARSPSLLGCVEGEARNPVAQRRDRVVDGLGRCGSTLFSQLGEPLAHRRPVVAAEDPAAFGHAAAVVQVGLVEHSESLDIGRRCTKPCQVFVEATQQLRGRSTEAPGRMPPLQQRHSLSERAIRINRRRSRRCAGYEHSVPVRIECRTDVTKRAGLDPCGIDELDRPEHVGV